MSEVSVWCLSMTLAKGAVWAPACLEDRRVSPSEIFSAVIDMSSSTSRANVLIYILTLTTDNEWITEDFLVTRL